MSGNNNNNSNNSEIIVAAAALVVSFVAFAATLMQCLQQYYASARGYSQCNPKVMGEWATTKERRFSWKELRFEVEFEAPVIFVCAPHNDKGPVPEADIFPLDGTEKSLNDTWTTLNMNPRKDYADRSPKERIHTADNERASWTILLSAVQYMENQSRKWHLKQFGYEFPEPPTPNALFRDHGLPSKPPTLESSHTLVVALQKKRKSWDTMPSNIMKPYATTTMCHLVEMLAALGVYWKVFDRRSDRYRAEGNGFMVLGERLSDLGLIFTFHVNGLSRYEENRIIPVDEIKELCFGWVPTIYRSTDAHDTRRLQVPINLSDLSSLQMGSRDEIAETLMIIGCNKNAINHYQGLEDPRSRSSHLFNLSFEILGMLSQTFHIPDTFYTDLPNPTPDVWDRRAVSMDLMLLAFKERFAQFLPDRPRNRNVVKRLERHMDDVIKHLEVDGDSTNNNVKTLLRFRALHAAIAAADEILTAKGKPSPAPSNAGTNGPLQQNATKEIKNQGSNGSPPGLSVETEQQRDRRIMVQDVLRSHIQEVLRLLNERDARTGDQRLLVPDLARPQSRGRGREASPSPHQDFGPSFEEMDEASPDERQHKMMDVYFLRIRRAAVPRAKEAAHRRASIIRPGASRRGSEASNSSVMSQIQEGVPTTSRLREVANAHDDELPPNATGPNDAENTVDSTPVSPRDGQTPGTVRFPVIQLNLMDEKVYYDDIWCTLVFRMICWLMLHDFSKLDKQLPRSELLGSRMPVYII